MNPFEKFPQRRHFVAETALGQEEWELYRDEMSTDVWRQFEIVRKATDAERLEKGKLLLSSLDVAYRLLTCFPFHTRQEVGLTDEIVEECLLIYKELKNERMEGLGNSPSIAGISALKLLESTRNLIPISDAKENDLITSNEWERLIALEELFKADALRGDRMEFRINIGSGARSQPFSPAGVRGGYNRYFELAALRKLIHPRDTFFSGKEEEDKLWNEGRRELDHIQNQFSQGIHATADFRNHAVNMAVLFPDKFAPGVIREESWGILLEELKEFRNDSYLYGIAHAGSDLQMISELTETAKQ